MKTILTILIIILSLNLTGQVDHEQGSIDKGLVMVYLGEYSHLTDRYEGLIDTGRAYEYQAIVENGTEVTFKSPKDLINYMKLKGFEFQTIHNILDVKGKDEYWSTCYVFIKT